MHAGSKLRLGDIFIVLYRSKAVPPSNTAKTLSLNNAAAKQPHSELLQRVDWTRLQN